MRKVKRILYNWYFTQEYGEEYLSCNITDQNISSIEEHIPLFNGDKHYCVIHYTDGSSEKVFNLNSIEYENFK